MVLGVLRKATMRKKKITPPNVNFTKSSLQQKFSAASYLPQLADEEDEHEPEEGGGGSSAHQNYNLHVWLPFFPCRESETTTQLQTN